jgi:AcrR family transcriptional regulator
MESATAAALLAAAPEESLDATGERILDAALEQFRRVGIRRSSVEDVARRAGVTRVTVYRRFPRKDRLIEAVVLRECRRAIAEVDARISALEDPVERTVEGFVAMVELVRSNPLLTGLMAVEPEGVLRQLTVDGRPVIEIGTAFIAEHIRRSQRAGELPAYDPEPVAEILARLAHSLLLTPDGRIPLDDLAQAREFARLHLTPILTQRPPG